MSLQQRRRALLKAALATPLASPIANLLLPGRAGAAEPPYPSRPVRFVTQSGPGDAVDLRLRDFLKGLTSLMNNQPLIAENHPGAGGVLAHQIVLNAPADGYTVMLANAALPIVPSIYRKLSYNPMRDFTAVAMQGQSAIALAIPASRPEKTFKDWLAWTRTQGTKLNYASAGNGSVSHLYGFQLSEQFGINATHIPYKGVAPALLDMVGGSVHFMMLDTFSLRPMLVKGNLRLLAVALDERSKWAPEVPTFKELGYTGYDRTGWTGYFVRTGTPVPVIDHLARAINTLNASAEWAAKREAIWSQWTNVSPNDIAKRLAYEAESWGAVVKKTGFYAD